MAILVEDSHPVATTMATDSDPQPPGSAVSLQDVDECIYLLAEVAVDLQGGELDGETAKALRPALDALGRVQQKRAKRRHEWLVGEVVEALAAVYKGVRESSLAPSDDEYDDEYDRRLKQALSRFGIVPTRRELIDLALDDEQVRSDADKTGPVESAIRALAPYVNEMIARSFKKPSHPPVHEPVPAAERALAVRLSGRKSPSSVRNYRSEAKKRAAPLPPTEAEVHAYLKRLAMSVEELCAEHEKT